MRKLTSLVLAFSLLFGLAHAAHAGEGDFAYRPQLVRSDVPALTSAHRLKQGGMALTILGTIASTLSIGLFPLSLRPSLAFNEHCQGGGGSNNPDCSSQGDPAMVGVHMGLGIGGALMIAAGVPMWSVGAKRERAIKKSVSVSASGAVLTF